MSLWFFLKPSLMAIFLNKNAFRDAIVRLARQRILCSLGCSSDWSLKISRTIFLDSIFIIILLPYLTEAGYKMGPTMRSWITRQTELQIALKTQFLSIARDKMKLIQIVVAGTVACTSTHQCSGTITKQRVLQLATGRDTLNRCDIYAIAVHRAKPKSQRYTIPYIF